MFVCQGLREDTLEHPCGVTNASPRLTVATFSLGQPWQSVVWCSFHQQGALRELNVACTVDAEWPGSPDEVRDKQRKLTQAQR